MALSPTQLSLRYLRKAGYRTGITEHWFQPPGQPGRRRDLWGFVDLVAVGHGELTFVQTTTDHNARARIRKICSDPCCHYALEALEVPGVSIHVHGWRITDPIRPRVYVITRAQVEQLLADP